jgi:hypothetical protein
VGGVFYAAALVAAEGLRLAGHRAADALHDPVCLLLWDLVENAVPVAAFEGIEQRSALPNQIPGKRFVVLALFVLGTPDNAAGMFFAAELVSECEVGGLRRRLAGVLADQRVDWDRDQRERQFGSQGRRGRRLPGADRAFMSDSRTSGYWVVTRSARSPRCALSKGSNKRSIRSPTFSHEHGRQVTSV